MFFDIGTLLSILFLIFPSGTNMGKGSYWLALLFWISVTILIVFAVIKCTDFRIPHNIIHTSLVASIIFLMVLACVIDTVAANRGITRGSTEYLLMSLPGLFSIGALCLLSLSDCLR